MTVWELAACIDGVNAANNPESKLEAPSEEEFEKMLEDYDHSQATAQ